jgi:hypothetical protein
VLHDSSIRFLDSDWKSIALPAHALIAVRTVSGASQYHFVRASDSALPVVVTARPKCLPW